MKIYRGLAFEPSISDPISPSEGDMFFSDAAHPTRDEGFWQYKTGDWEQFGTGSGSGGGIAVARDLVSGQTGTTITFTTPYTLEEGTLFYRNGVLMHEVAVFSGGISNAEEMKEVTSTTIELNASDPAVASESFALVSHSNVVLDANLFDARGEGSGLLTEDCTITVVSDKTRMVLDFPFTYTTNKNVGGAYGEIAIHINGQRIERKIAGTNDGVGNIIYDEVSDSTVDIYEVIALAPFVAPIPATVVINASMVRVTASAPPLAGDFFANGSVPMTGSLDLDGQSVINADTISTAIGSDLSFVTDGQFTFNAQGGATELAIDSSLATFEVPVTFNGTLSPAVAGGTNLGTATEQWGEIHNRLQRVYTSGGISTGLIYAFSDELRIGALSNKHVKIEAGSNGRIKVFGQTEGNLQTGSAGAGTLAFDLSLGNAWNSTITENKTISFTNAIPAGTTYSTVVLAITASGGAYTLTFPTAKWKDGVPVDVVPLGTTNIYTIIFMGTDIYITAVDNMSTV